jgi:hypothetical protein
MATAAMLAAREAPASLSPHYYQYRGQLVSESLAGSWVGQGRQPLEQPSFVVNILVGGYGG